MPSSNEHAGEQRQPSYLVYLLISLVFILLIVPVIEQRPFATGLLRLGLTAVLVSAAIAVGVSADVGTTFVIVAGLIVSESDLSHQAAGEITPFRDLFAVLFFVSVGMLVDPAALLT